MRNKVDFDSRRCHSTFFLRPVIDLGEEYAEFGVPEVVRSAVRSVR